MKFKYKKIAIYVSVIVLGVGMVVFNTKTLKVDSSTELESDNSKLSADNTENSTDLNEVSADPSEDQQRVKADVDRKIAEIVTAAAIVEPEPEIKIPLNTNEEVYALIQEFLNAKIECDEDRLKAVVDDAQVIDINDIQRRTERIEQYKAIDCYMLDGPEEDSYVVLVYHKIKISGVSTPASALDVLYVRAKSEGGYQICLGDIDDDILEKIDALLVNEEVDKLIAKVNEELEQEMNSDEKLRTYYEELNLPDEDAESSEDAESAEGSEETEDTENKEE